MAKPTQPVNKPLHVEQLALNQREVEYLHDGKPTYCSRLHWAEVQARPLEVGPPPSPRKPDPALVNAKYYMEDTGYYFPTRPASMPGASMPNDWRQPYNGKMPAPGWQWTEKRLKHARTVTEEDLADLRDHRAKYGRYAIDKVETKEMGVQTDEPLYLWRISRKKVCGGGYDNYLDAMVVAANEGEARLLHPGGDNYQTFFDSDDNEVPWWQWAHHGKTRQEEWEEAVESRCRWRDIRGDFVKGTPPPGWWLGGHDDWVHPAFVEVTLVSSYDGDEPAGTILHSSFLDG